jgi:hypothetical protein
MNVEAENATATQSFKHLQRMLDDEDWADRLDWTELSFSKWKRRSNREVCRSELREWHWYRIIWLF